MSREPKKTEKKKLPDDKMLGVGTELLAVDLTTEELLDRGQRLAQQHQLLREHEDHAEQVKKNLKSQEAAIVAERSRLSGIVQQKKEPRDVMVERWARYDDGVVEDVRMDTGEVFRSRRMEQHERQATLPLPKVDGATVTLSLRPADWKPPEDVQDIASKSAPNRTNGTVTP